MYVCIHTRTRTDCIPPLPRPPIPLCPTPTQAARGDPPQSTSQQARRTMRYAADAKPPQSLSWIPCRFPHAPSQPPLRPDSEWWGVNHADLWPVKDGIPWSVYGQLSRGKSVALRSSLALIFGEMRSGLGLEQGQEQRLESSGNISWWTDMKKGSPARVRLAPWRNITNRPYCALRSISNDSVHTETVPNIYETVGSILSRRRLYETYNKGTFEMTPWGRGVVARFETIPRGRKLYQTCVLLV